MGVATGDNVFILDDFARGHSAQPHLAGTVQKHERRRGSLVHEMGGFSIRDGYASRPSLVFNGAALSLTRTGQTFTSGDSL